MPSRYLIMLLMLCFAWVAAMPATAQSYPTRPVTLVVPFPPCGGTDTGGRIMAEQLSKRWGQPVVIDNKGGAAGQIGADIVAKAKPDGYTLLRALAVTGNKRLPALPDVPTLSENSLPGFNAISWLGLLAPKGTPPSMVDKIAADVRAILMEAAVKLRYVALGGIPRATTPQEFSALIVDDRQRYAQVIRSRKITAE